MAISPLSRKLTLGLGLSVALGLSGLHMDSARALEAVDFQFKGVSDDLADELRAASLTQAAKVDGRTAPQDVLAAAQADYASMTGVLYAQGYYSGVVHVYVDGREAATVPPLDQLRDVKRVVISVDPGDRFNFGKAEITPLPQSAQLPARFATGRAARSTAVKDAVGAGIGAWRSEGHAKAAVAGQKITANHNKNQLDVAVTLRTGPKLRFHKLVFSGSSKVREERLQKIAGLRGGETFDPEVLDTIAQRLRRTGAFRSVSITEAEQIGPNDTIDLEAVVVDAKPRRIGFGAEYSTQDGAALSGYWMHRNLLGGAERLRLEASVSGITGETGGVDYRLSADFERPASFGTDTALTLGALAEHLDEPDYTSDQLSFSVGMRRIINEHLTGEVAVEWRRSRIEDSLGRREYDLLSLPLELTWDKRDNVLNTRNGSYLQANLRPFYAQGSVRSGGRIALDGRYYQPLGAEGKTVAAVRLQFGSLFGPDVASAPPDYLFYSGGGGTVRGQDYQSLGVDLPDGRRRGGRSFVGLSGELRVATGKKLSVVGFADAGYIGEEAFFDGSGAWHSGAGLGLRYDTGIGPIRVDLAAPTSGGGDGVHLYIGIGQAF
ncbi:autotransporter assembly complex family protein [Litorivita sp. NS0012-18]|uniref:autotransporter assembly complex protein TamA n=1 Tax=Litorivita sp. NS0012-18 TaxID=3127655 RepID=UPI00310703F3